jgi:hypothetical protein
LYQFSASGGARPISFEVIARTWFHRVRLCTDAAEIFEGLRYLECDPEILTAFTKDLRVSVEPRGSNYQIVRDGEVIQDCGAPAAVADMLHAKIVLLSLADFPTAPIIHAASLRRNGRRMLLVGPKGGGKTTLSLRLLQEGYEIEGDENVFITPEGVAARPRALRVKETTALLFAPVAEALRGAAYYESAQGVRTYNLDPRKAGAAFWRIERGSVDAAILIRPNHNGCSSLRPITTLTLIRDVIAESAFPETERGRAVRDITKMLVSARGFDLYLGDLDGAVSCLEGVFS